MGGLCFHDDGHDDRDDDRKKKKLPGYLLDAPKNGHIYGTLSYNRAEQMLDDQGRAVRDGDGGAAVSGQSAAAGEKRDSRRTGESSAM